MDTIRIQPIEDGREFHMISDCPRPEPRKPAAGSRCGLVLAFEKRNRTATCERDHLFSWELLADATLWDILA